VRVAFLLWIVTFLAVLAAQLFILRPDATPERADAIVCLGAGMAGEDSPLAGPASSRRARACAALFREGAAPVIVFTGYGTEAGSAAEAMADVARSEGAPEEAMRIDPDALSTIQNAAFGIALLPRVPDRVILVSDGFHLPRAWVIFRLMGVEDVALHRADRGTLNVGAWPELLGWSIREAFAIWFNLARLTAYGLGGLAGIDHDTRIGWFD
jgi:uncharacterized SAM-binding protein YcdF (DUF218 family)